MQGPMEQVYRYKIDPLRIAAGLGERLRSGQNLHRRMKFFKDNIGQEFKACGYPGISCAGDYAQRSA